MRPLSALPALLVPLFLGLLPHIQELGVVPKTTDALELFSGEKAITLNCLELGLNAVGYDKSYSTPYRSEDITTKSGFRNALKEVMKVKRGGFIWGGPECKTWIFMARHGTLRSQYRAYGDSKVKRVANANLMVINLVTLLCLAWMMEVALVKLV